MIGKKSKEGKKGIKKEMGNEVNCEEKKIMYEDYSNIIEKVRFYEYVNK